MEFGKVVNLAVVKHHYHSGTSLRFYISFGYLLIIDFWAKVMSVQSISRPLDREKDVHFNPKLKLLLGLEGLSLLQLFYRQPLIAFSAVWISVTGLTFLELLPVFVNLSKLPVSFKELAWIHSQVNSLFPYLSIPVGVGTLLLSCSCDSLCPLPGRWTWKFQRHT